MRVDSLARTVLPALLLLLSACAQSGRLHLVCDPLVPVEGRGLETQLLYGESVIVHEEGPDRLRVEAVEQPEFNHHDRWEGYPGWVTSKALVPVEKTAWRSRLVASKGDPVWVIRVRKAEVRRLPDRSSEVVMELWLGTRLFSAGEVREGWAPVLLLDGATGWIAADELWPARPELSPAERRTRILSIARLSLGRPYLWGGRSPDAPDCSGLVNIAYRCCGIDIPRDAHEQSLRASAIRSEELQPGDLIFTSRPRSPDRVTHVMLYVDDATIIEAERSGVREVPFKRAVGITLEELRAGRKSVERVSFGRFIR